MTMMTCPAPRVNAGRLPTSAALPASKSHKKRSYHWLPAAPGSFHLGTVTVLQERLADSYAVDEDTSEPFPGRAFLLAKLDAAGDVYRVGVLSPTRATCSGMYCGRHPTCKHRCCILDLLAKGSLDPAPVPACTFCHDHGFVPTEDLSAEPCPACQP